MNIFKTFLTVAFAVSACLAEGSVESTTLKDADGNVYKTVKIGNQVWSVENLRTTKYNDGTPIPIVKDSAAWVALKTPGYCYYENTTNADNIKKFGALYNWYAVDTRKLAPTGWHVPTDAEWDTLQSYLIAHGHNSDGTKTGNNIGKALKVKTEWETYAPVEYDEEFEGQIGNDLTKYNSSGFSAVPGGFLDSYGNFRGQSTNGIWWSATVDEEPYVLCRSLDNADGLLDRFSYYRSYGFSIRLVRD